MVQKASRNLMQLTLSSISIVAKLVFRITFSSVISKVIPKTSSSSSSKSSIIEIFMHLVPGCSNSNVEKNSIKSIPAAIKKIRKVINANLMNYVRIVYPPCAVPSTVEMFATALLPKSLVKTAHTNRVAPSLVV